jgi:hypothetical protein
MRWSKLRKLLTELFDPELDLQIHCTSHRGEEIAIGRYWFVLDGETIWEVPRRVAPDLAAGIENPVASRVTAILREYLDTPRDDLPGKKFEGDEWGLADLLRAADRRIGKRRLEQLTRADLPQAARKVVEKRLNITPS